MLRSYLLLALRTLRRRRSYTLVNGLGLTVGLGCCALVAVFLQYELSYDAHHRHADRTYRILSTWGTDTFSSIRFKDFYQTSADDQVELARRLKQEVPAVEQATNFEILDTPLFVRTASGDRFESERQLVTNTGAAFADVFTFDRLAGAPLSDALAEPGSAVLTRSTARAYYGEANPIGETLQVGSSTTVTVRAIIADPPSNSRITFDLALALPSIPNWAAYHYVRLQPGADPSAVTPQISAVMDAVNPSRVEEDADRHTGERLQTLTDVHLAERALYDDTAHRDPAYLWAFGAIGLLILVITIINYANLALALYAGRNAEIGVRKAMGGHRAQLTTQFLAEAALLALACVPLAAMVCAAVLPAFNVLMETRISAGAVLAPSVLATMTGLALLTGLAAGSYPALVLARRNAAALFGRSESGVRTGGTRLRRGLIAAQFAVVIVLGSLTWIAHDQLDFMQNDDLGYRTDGVVELVRLRADSTQYQQLKRRLIASPAVEAVGVGERPRTRTNRGSFSVTGTGETFENGDYSRVDPDWFDVMGIEHPALDDVRAMGAAAPEVVFVNQTLADRVSATDLVGRGLINVPDDPPENPPEIVGILPDQHFNSKRLAITPRHFHVIARPSRAFAPVVRLAGGQTQEGLAHVRDVVGDMFPAVPLRTAFLDDRVASLYEQERRFGTLGTVLTGIAVVLAVLGLSSLVAYLTRLRRKEIGIRKALGGSTASIVALLNKEYVWIVAAAFTVGAPLAWIVASWWLDQFAYRVDVSLLAFAVTGAAAFAVAALTVSTQATRAAQVDPATVLRVES